MTMGFGLSTGVGRVAAFESEQFGTVGQIERNADRMSRVLYWRNKSEERDK